MSPCWNVIHDKRQFTFPGNCLEMVEEPVVAGRVIVRGSCYDCVCAGILSVLREGQDILETRVRDTGEYRDSTIRMIHNCFDNGLSFFPVKERKLSAGPQWVRPRPWTVLRLRLAVLSACISLEFSRQQIVSTRYLETR